MERSETAKRLIKLRGNKTQAEVAEKLGISQSSYAMYETGQRIPSDEVKIRIANFYNRTVQFIFFNHDVT